MTTPAPSGSNELLLAAACLLTDFTLYDLQELG
jgi:hypothetical protein